jgi:electron transfer flavoprotein alpha subunit
MECWSNGVMDKARSNIPILHHSVTPMPQSLNMETILFLAHTEADGTLAKPALEALGAAQSLNAALAGSRLLVGFVGENVAMAATQIASCGAAKFLGVAGADFTQARYASDAAAAEALCKAAHTTLVIAPATSRFNRCLAGVAQRVGGGADTHVASLSAQEGKVTITRWYYRQRMEGTLTRTQRPWFILVDPGSHPAWSGAAGTASVESVAVTLADSAKRTTVTGFRAPAADAQTIRPDAQLLFVTGAGWTKKQADGQTHVPEAEKLILGFLKLTRASLGSSKSLVDLGGEGQAVLSFLSHMNQIGQTGATPRHPKGLSTCCHGEEPHTVGWRFINERRAISLDPNCGWARGKADVLYVADAFQVIAKVNKLLEAQRNG